MKNKEWIKGYNEAMKEILELCKTFNKDKEFDMIISYIQDDES